MPLINLKLSENLVNFLSIIGICFYIAFCVMFYYAYFFGYGSLEIMINRVGEANIEFIGLTVTNMVLICGLIYSQDH